MSRRIRIFLADNHPLTLLVLEKLVTAEAGLDLVGQAANGIEAFDRIRIVNPDLAVVNVGLPGINGIALAREIREKQPSTKVLMLTAREEVSCLLQALAAGASGFLCKRSAVMKLMAAIRVAACGGIYIDALMVHRAGRV